MDTGTKTIYEALDLLGEELRPHINKLFMTKELLIESPDDFVYGDFDRFKSGLYNVMDEVTEAYTRVYERIELLGNDKPAAAH